MFKKNLTDKVFCGLDIGSQKIKAVILKAKGNNQIELLGAYEHYTNGFKDGSVVDLGELSDSIQTTIQELSKKTSVKIKDVELGLPGELVEVRQASSVIPLIDRGNKIISNGDVKRVNHQARLLGLKMEEDILHDLPQYYQVDEINSALNPLGLYGRKLAVQSLMVVTNTNRIQNLMVAVNRAGYDVDKIMFSSFAASEVITSPEDRLEGCIVIDIGAKVTSIFIFKDRVLKYLDRIMMGAEDLTRSISARLNLPFDLAEEIKKTYAVALGGDHQKDEDILVKKENQYVPIKREAIYQAIETQIHQFVEAIERSVQKSELLEQVTHGVKISGGGALLPGLIERIAEKFSGHVELAKLNSSIQKSLINTAVFAPAIGLAYGGFLSATKSSSEAPKDRNFAQQMIGRVKELYQEYF